MKNDHPFLRRISWNPFIAILPTIYLAVSSNYVGFTTGRIIATSISIIWVLLSTYNLISNYKFLDRLYRDEIQNNK
jgi:hypothetical protein